MNRKYKQRSDATTCTHGVKPKSSCLKCCAEYVAQYRRRYPDRVRESTYSARRKPVGRFKFVRTAALRRDREWTLTLEECERIWSQSCYYGSACKMPETGVGMDRIDNTKGYTLENVLPCCDFHNQLRSNLLTVEETLVCSQALEEYRRSKRHAA